jgi:hypothetical protein
MGRPRIAESSRCTSWTYALGHPNYSGEESRSGITDYLLTETSEQPILSGDVKACLVCEGIS